MKGENAMYASRNIDLCTKDCLCLFVCPTGATDTETGQIDKNLCLDGCRLCVDACPSHAIYLVMSNYADPKHKDETLAGALMGLLESKADQEAVARSAAAENPGAQKLARALQKSMRILAEDCAREGGFMLPQSAASQALLAELAQTEDQQIQELAVKLLEK